jgi:hypothetical protein
LRPTPPCTVWALLAAVLIPAQGGAERREPGRPW